MLDKKCAHQPFGTVAFNRFAEFFRSGKANFFDIFLGEKEKHHTLSVETFPFFVKITKLLVEFYRLKTT